MIYSEKDKLAIKWYRENHLQDHASRGNSHRGREYDPWYGFKEGDLENNRRRQEARQGGLIERE